MCCARHDDFCVFDRLFRGTDQNTNGRRLSLGEDRSRWIADKNDKNTHHQYERARTHLRGCSRTSIFD